MKATKVTLRQRLLNSGKITLYLDFYPPLKDPETKKNIRHEYLGIYLVKSPKSSHACKYDILFHNYFFA